MFSQFTFHFVPYALMFPQFTFHFFLLPPNVSTVNVSFPPLSPNVPTVYISFHIKFINLYLDDLRHKKFIVGLRLFFMFFTDDFGKNDPQKNRSHILGQNRSHILGHPLLEKTNTKKEK